MTTDSVSISPLYRRHAVRVNNRAQKKSMLNLREEGKMRMSEWGRTKLDTLRFATLSDPVAGLGYGAHQLRRVGAAATDNAILAAGKLTLQEISKAKYALRAQEAPGWNIQGQTFYVIVVDLWAEYDLKNNDTNWNLAQRDAAARGASNPLFTGAVGVWDGVVILTADRIVAANNTAATPVRIAQNLMFGREAFAEAYGSYGSWVEKTFDYDLEFGIAYGFDYGCMRSWEKYSLQLRSSAVVQA